MAQAFPPVALMPGSLIGDKVPYRRIGAAHDKRYPLTSLLGRIQAVGAHQLFCPLAAHEGKESRSRRRFSAAR
jgi:hypothetical protein